MFTGEFLVSKKLKMPNEADWSEADSKVVTCEMIKAKTFRLWDSGDMRIEEHPPKHFLHKH